MSCANAEGAIPSFVVYGMQRNSADEVHKNAVRLLRESTLLSSPNLTVGPVTSAIIPSRSMSDGLHLSLSRSTMLCPSHGVALIVTTTCAWRISAATSGKVTVSLRR
jgi:hypothetical protein